MGPRSAGFDEIEAGYAQQAAEEEALELERANEDLDEDEEKAPVDEDDELELAAREYLSEMRSGMSIAEEDEISI